MEAQLGLNPVNLTDQATVGWAEGLSLSGTYASRPAAGIPNRVYYCTDCDALYQDNGTSWVKIRLGGVGGPPMADPPTTGWTSVNMGTATWVSDKDGMVLTAPSRSMSIGYVYRAYPVGAFSLVTNFYVDLANTTVLPSAGNWWRCGLVISDGTKLETFGPGLYNALVCPVAVRYRRSMGEYEHLQRGDGNLVPTVVLDWGYASVVAVPIRRHYHSLLRVVDQRD